MKTNHKCTLIFSALLFGTGLSDAFCQSFDNLISNWGTPKTIVFQSSIYGNGFQHKIYNDDLGNGQVFLRIAANNNTGSYVNHISIHTNGKVGIGESAP